MGLQSLIFGKGRSVTEGAGRHVAVSMKCTLTVMLMVSAGSASLLICVFCLVLASTVLSSQPFLLSEQSCSPPGPWLLQSLFLHPACHSLVLQAGGADLEDEKSSKRYWPLLNSHSYKDFFSPCNFGMLLSETIHSLGRLWMG